MRYKNEWMNESLGGIVILLQLKRAQTKFEAASILARIANFCCPHHLRVPLSHGHHQKRHRFGR